MTLEHLLLTIVPRSCMSPMNDDYAKCRQSIEILNRPTEKGGSLPEKQSLLMMLLFARGWTELNDPTQLSLTLKTNCIKVHRKFMSHEGGNMMVHNH